ncbi:MAG: sulfite exporter TauE/SafE family protein [Bacteroidota bacterium]|nr:sulfite exporter TauE/SafE family protein [Bacteroidota bacterium]
MLFALIAVFIGMSKTGIHGAGMMAVPLLALVFGGQLSSGILLPILCLADVIGVCYYHRHASWYHLKKLFPSAAVGTVLGTVVGGMIDDHTFKLVMAAIIVVSIVIMLWLERAQSKAVPDYKWFASLTGVGAGFTSMIGNLATSVVAIYMLSMRLPKNAFIGTTAWFFLVLNWFKVPFHVFSWKTITWNTFFLDLATIPFIALGAFLGVVIVRKIQDKAYRWFIIAMTLVAAVFMLL